MHDHGIAVSDAVAGGRVRVDCWDGPHFRISTCGINDFRQTPPSHAMFMDAMEVQGCWEYVLSGAICYRVGSESYRVGEGEALVTRRPDPGWMHRPVKDTRVQTLWVIVMGECSMRMFDYLHVRYGQIQRFSPDSRVVRLARRLVSLANEQPYRPAHFWSARTFQWMNAWWECALENQRPGNVALSAIKPSRLISHAPRTMKNFAAEMGYSRAYLTRTLTRQWKQSPGRVLREVRLQEAATLLRTTRLDVSEIATKVGYTAAGAFSRAFSRQFGESPRKYRLSQLRMSE